MFSNDPTPPDTPNEDPGAVSVMEQLVEMRRNGVVQFKCTDTYGEDHIYLCTLFPAEEGFAIAAGLLAISSGPIGKVLEGTLGTILAGEMDWAEIVEMDPVEVLAGVDASAVGEAIAKALQGTNIKKLLRALFAHTTRAGKPLKTRSVFDHVYRANYGELLWAARSILRANNLLPF